MISLEGPFATSSDWAVPGSDGDTCTRTAAGGLLFRSRLFQAPNGPEVLVAIRLPRFHGQGLYRTEQVPARALGPAEVLITVGVGIHGWTTFRSATSLVTVTQATTTMPGGRFHAALTAYRQPFRVHGAWRCLAG